jgi:hypothetical protein
MENLNRFYNPTDKSPRWLLKLVQNAYIGQQLVFSGWGKPEYPEKNPPSTGENQPNLYLHELISKWMLLS